MRAVANDSWLQLLAPPFSPLSALPSAQKLKPLFCYYFPTSQNISPLLYPPPITCLTLSKQKPSPKPLTKIPLRKPRNLRASATSEDAAVTAAQEVVVSSTTSGDDGVSNVISILLFVAFVGLSILTIGVIYIAVTDFLQKREKEKFEKEEGAKNKKKKGGKKGRVRARAGPRGFGQKIDDDDDDI